MNGLLELLRGWVSSKRTARRRVRGIKLDELPDDILHEICELLDINDGSSVVAAQLARHAEWLAEYSDKVGGAQSPGMPGSRSTLYSLALTNRKLSRAAMDVRFRSAQLETSQRLQQFWRSLRSSGRFESVRHIHILLPTRKELRSADGLETVQSALDMIAACLRLVEVDISSTDDVLESTQADALLNSLSKLTALLHCSIHLPDNEVCTVYRVLEVLPVGVQSIGMHLRLGSLDEQSELPFRSALTVVNVIGLESTSSACDLGFLACAPNLVRIELTLDASISEMLGELAALPCHNRLTTVRMGSVRNRDMPWTAKVGKEDIPQRFTCLRSISFMYSELLADDVDLLPASLEHLEFQMTEWPVPTLAMRIESGALPRLKVVSHDESRVAKQEAAQKYRDIMKAACSGQGIDLRWRRGILSTLNLASDEEVLQAAAAFDDDDDD